jgi:hypothetical protein
MHITNFKPKKFPNPSQDLFLWCVRALSIFKEPLFQIAFRSRKSRAPGDINTDQNDNDQKNSGEDEKDFLVLVQFGLL